MGREEIKINITVSTSSDDIVDWNRSRIVEVLMRETFIDRDTAEMISEEVESEILASGIRVTTAALIREMVDAKLLEKGLEKERKRHGRLGMPVYDVEQVIQFQNKENANVPHNPEATNLVIAETIKKQYALNAVFSEKVGHAHLSGDMHIHNLGLIDRPHSSIQSLEYVKCFGLNLPGSLSVSKPARNADVLISHLVRFSAVLQNHFAGEIGWDGANILMAPYVSGLPDSEVAQLAQKLLFDFSQQAVARGGQPVFADLHFYWDVPRHLSSIPAIGPGGSSTGKGYAEYLPDARRFMREIFRVYLAGDGAGRPFFFPRPILHVGESFWTAPEAQEMRLLASQVAAEKGSVHFLFERDKKPWLANRMLKGKEQGRGRARNVKAEPWKWRYSALQGITLNLPRLGYTSLGNDTLLFSRLSALMELAAMACEEKRYYIERLLSFGEDGPLSLLTMRLDGQAYYRMSSSACLIGMVGLNELVKIQKGEELHQSEEARKYGYKIISHMKTVADRLSRRTGIEFILEQSPAESAAGRFARLDLRYHSPFSGRVTKGDLSKEEVYYTNSTCLAASATIPALQRVQWEGAFHPLIEGETLTPVWLGENLVSPDSISEFLHEVYQGSNCRQLVFTPEFTLCWDCGTLERGIRDVCGACDSAFVDGISRITGYLSRISGWNKGKLGELHERYRYSQLL